MVVLAEPALTGDWARAAAEGGQLRMCVHSVLWVYVYIDYDIMWVLYVYVDLLNHTSQTSACACACVCARVIHACVHKDDAPAHHGK